MAKNYRTPGVYVEEISKLPPSVAEVETAIPAFIGYTKNISFNGSDLTTRPVRIKSLAEYVEIFGMPNPVIFKTAGEQGIKIKKVNEAFQIDGQLADPSDDLKYRMYYSLQLYFANGGGPCYIASCGTYGSQVEKDALDKALKAVRKEDEPTIIVFTDAVSLTDKDEYYGLCVDALKQSSELMDRMVLVDLYLDPSKKGNVPFEEVDDEFRSGIGNNYLSYGAAYYPWLHTTLDYYIDESKIAIIRGEGVTSDMIKDNTFLRKYPAEGSVEVTDPDTSLYHWQSLIYALVKKEIARFKLIMPPSPAIAGVYAMVDNTRGVWKSPANVSLNYVKAPMVRIDDSGQEEMNISVTGKSVNAIRSFSGKGVMVWGARTLAGNDNEWKYVAVRRFYNMVEESLKKATEPFIFESNDKKTWTRMKAMAENYLTLRWRDGALQGAKPDDAFFVHVGLGETMTALDIMEGRMIVEIGMAVVRPAEFIILRFSHKMVVS